MYTIKCLTIFFFTSCTALAIGQNVGINQPNPLFSLDINGDLNLRSGLRINSSRGDSGAVVMSNGANGTPVWNKWQGFSAGAATNQTINTTANLNQYNEISFTNISGTRFSIGTGYNSSTSRYTVLEDGVYLIMASVSITNCPAATYRISVQNPFSSGSFSSSTLVVPSTLSIVELYTSKILYISAGTTLRTAISSTTANALVINNGVNTYFSVVKL